MSLPKVSLNTLKDYYETVTVIFCSNPDTGEVRQIIAYVSFYDNSITYEVKIKFSDGSQKALVADALDEALEIYNSPQGE